MLSAQAATRLNHQANSGRTSAVVQFKWRQKPLADVGWTSAERLVIQHRAALERAAGREEFYFSFKVIHDHHDVDDPEMVKAKIFPFKTP